MLSIAISCCKSGCPDVAESLLDSGVDGLGLLGSGNVLIPSGEVASGKRCALGAGGATAAILPFNNGTELDGFRSFVAGGSSRVCVAFVVEVVRRKECCCSPDVLD